MSLHSSSFVSRPANRFRSPASLATAAVATAVVAPSLLQAQIIWSGALGTTVNSGAPDALLDLNLNTISDAPEAHVHWFSGGTPFLNVGGNASAKSDPGIAFLYNDAPVTFGATIDASLGGYVGEHPADLVPADGTARYYAFEYQAAGGPYYGWMQLTFSADRQTGTLNQWAYNSVAGAALGAGQTSAIPEPGAYAALLGVAALSSVWWRQRQRRARLA
jgi:hypothetical protein